MRPDQSGIAGGWPGRPETEGIFLTNPGIDDARFFAWMGRGRRVDVWRVDVRSLELEDLSDEGGWWVCRTVIPAKRLELVEVWDTSEESPQDLRPVPLPPIRREPRSRRQR
jgi:hypothetical protein